MVNNFCATPLFKCSKELADVAMGRTMADLVITNAKLINVCTKEIIPNIDVAVKCGRIALIGKCQNVIGKETTVIDANGKYLAPSFMDGHIHIESSMLGVGEYAKAVIPHGTSGVFIDPHEICNVLGLVGVKCMLQDAKRSPLKVMLTTPSCVPAVNGFEDTGANIGPDEITETMGWKETVGLGEMMNFPGVINSNDRVHEIVGRTLMEGKIVTGHYPTPSIENELNAYIDCGARCDHESTTEEQALAKMRLGMYTMLREGSGWRDMAEVAKAITKHQVDSRFACLCSDDAHPDTLINDGHLDHIINRAIEEGIDSLSAIQMVTLNVAQCFQLDHELGSIAPGKCADMVMFSDLNKITVSEVIIDGNLVAKNGKLTIKMEDYEYPNWATHSIHTQKKEEKDFIIKGFGESVKVRTIDIVPTKTITTQGQAVLKVKDGNILADGENDVLKAVVIDRHHINGKAGYGFVRGFGIKEGALAQTIAHDAHNLLVIGSNEKDMMVAVNALIDCNGGMVAVKNGKVIGKVPLPIAGIMSDKTAKETNELVMNMEKVWEKMGCKLPSPFMTMALIPLACIPDIRLTNRGLVDCVSFKFVDLIIKDNK